MFLRLSFLHLLLATLQISATLAIGDLPDRIVCSARIVAPVDPGDCVVLLTILQSKTWFSRPTIFGPSEPPPRKTPLEVVHGTCVFRLFSVHTSMRGRLQLSNHLEMLEKIVSDCLVGRVYRSGYLHLYTRQFAVYLGGDHDLLEGGANVTTTGENVVEA